MRGAYARTITGRVAETRVCCELVVFVASGRVVVVRYGF